MNNRQLARLFHENSKQFDVEPSYTFTSKRFDHTVEYKEYERFERLSLDLDQSNGLIDDVLEHRRSPELFDGDRCERRQLERVLSGLKITDEKFGNGVRAYPSAGARYPNEIYLSVSEVSDIDPGVYHFNILEECLEKICDEPIRADVYEMNGQEFVNSTAFFVILTSNFGRSTEKYGIRGYRYAYFEAGHMTQNLILCAEATGLAARPIGGFMEDTIDELLMLSNEETSIYMCAFGSVAEEDHDE